MRAPDLLTSSTPDPLIRQRLLRLWRTPAVNRLLNGSLRYAPGPVRAYVERQRLRVRLRERRRALPEQPFRRLLNRGITELAGRSGTGGLGDYLEFGVYNCTSLVSAFRELAALQLHHVRLFGFDSFQGLPAAAASEDDGVWQPGAWSSDLAFAEAVLAAERVERARVTLVPGWFSDTCTANTARRHDIAKASVIMVDCDLCSSTREALEFCAPLIRDHALIVFDDWHAGQLAAKNMGERRAFEEWLASSQCFSAEPFGSYNRKSESFIVSRVA